MNTERLLARLRHTKILMFVWGAGFMGYLVAEVVKDPQWWTVVVLLVNVSALLHAVRLSFQDLTAASGDDEPHSADG